MSYALLSQRAPSGGNGGILTGASADNQFQAGAITNEDSDDSGIVSLSSNQFTLQTGVYRIRGVASFGCTPALDGVGGKVILWSVSSGAIKTNKDTAVNIIGTAVKTGDPSTFNQNTQCDIMGRFEVTGSNEIFELRMAGDAGTGTWYNSTVAQGVTSSISAGTYQEVYKLVEILME